MKKFFYLLIISLLLISCSNNENNVKKQVHIKKSILKDTKSFEIIINQFANNIESIWGPDEILIAGPKRYIKYTDKYETRSCIDFDNGIVIIETINTIHPQINLRKAIIDILLMEKNVDTTSNNSNIKSTFINKNPFLYKQVLDYNNQPINSRLQAFHFANYLLNKKLKIRLTKSSRYIWYITINLVSNHINQRAHEYFSLINILSRKYKVDKYLILAIIQVESSFNPYAISDSNALGLMQIVQNTAGRDVFKMKGKYGQPSRRYLLNPENNIDIGTAYLSILQYNYLYRIENPISRKYAVIIAYNGGVNNMLNIFSKNKEQAFKIINRMKPDYFYRQLYTKHPSIESRLYLYKVNELQKNYHYKQ